MLQMNAIISATVKQKANTHTSKKLNVFLHAYTNEHRMIQCVFMRKETKNLLHPAPNEEKHG